MLRLGRSRATDEELQYKAALSVGSLAANAVKNLPSGTNTGAGVGFAVGAANKAKDKTKIYMDKQKELE
mgnify:CR=1 FL=1